MWIGATVRPRRARRAQVRPTRAALAPATRGGRSEAVRGSDREGKSRSDMARKLMSIRSSSFERSSLIARRPRAARRRGTAAGTALARAVEALERRRLLTVTQPTLSLDASTDGGALGDAITNFN